MKNILLCLILSLTFTSTYSQITIQNTQTPTDLVQNVLLGFGVTASNITINGNAGLANTIQGNVTYFDATSTSFPIPNGVLLTTGNGTAAAGPNNSGSFTNNFPATADVSYDPDLNAIASSGVTNGVVLEFDFVPSGDTILFNYVFASDEYPEFSPSSFNDAFGFFLSGPGFAGPYQFGAVNLAVVPGTSTPVTINNVGPSSNTAYYVNNQNGAAYGTAIQYDGATTVLSANASVQCGQTYHIKLAISNVGDNSYDSGVFLQANSFASEAVEISVAPSVAGDTSVFEGCTTADITFIRPESQTADTLVVNYTIGGTATNGVDFNTLPNPVMFLPGQDSITLTINPIADGISDNNEFIIFTATTITVCGDTIVSTGVLYILDSIDFDITETDPMVQCVSDSVLVSAFANGQFGPFTYLWEDGQVGDTAYFPTVTPGPTGTVDYLVTATNSCGYSFTDTVTITLNQTLNIDTFFVGPATCEPDGFASAVVSGNTGLVQYMWSGPGTNPGNFGNQSVITDLGGGYYYLTVQDNVCSFSDSVFVPTENVPSAAFSLSNTFGCVPLTVTLTNNSTNANSFTWDFGNGNSTTVGNMDPIVQTYNVDGVVTLIASNGNPACNDTTSSFIDVEICGCMDPEADNYDSTATFSDNSCQYTLPIPPDPVFELPNIFTPNGDGTNDQFFIMVVDPSTVMEIELVILNRWGNVVFEETSKMPIWNGKSTNGEMAQDGTYFYKYRLMGINNIAYSGHGFVQLAND